MTAGENDKAEKNWGNILTRRRRGMDHGHNNFNKIDFVMNTFFKKITKNNNRRGWVARERERERESKLVFYDQSTDAVISERERARAREGGRERERERERERTQNSELGTLLLKD